MTAPEALRGPRFGSYAPDDVAWLLTDLSHVVLEAPTEEREEAVQAGRAHYAESLPIEYQPDAEYRELFTAALESSARRLAFAVGLVAEQIRSSRPRPVLMSLARAGTPVGILIRRWLLALHGIDAPHYAVSIVRGRGIDRVALEHVAARHDSADVVAVDGWTGKGAIARELAEALAAVNAETGTRFSAELAVLADPGRCTTVFGTRDDYLIPSACLNSTVSGLVSRTVLNPALIGARQFHGAKFYAQLAPADVSVRFIDRVEREFAAVRDDVADALPGHLAADRTAMWTGEREVRRIGAAWGISNTHLIKPGVGETTRVLLRRVPWRVLVQKPDDPDLRHVRLLAERRGVPLVVDPDLAYRAVGLIRPAEAQ